MQRPVEQQRFVGKNVVIPGGNSGIGRATALAFRDEGARVAVIGRNPVTLEEMRRELGDAGVVISADLAQLSAVDDAMSQAIAALGTIDVLFTCAGTGAMIPVVDTSEALWNQIMNVNLKGTYFTVQKAIPHLANPASIIICSSVGALRTWPGSSVYSASKAALNALGRAFAGELLAQGVRVNVVIPGGIDTPIMTRTPGVPAGAAAEVMNAMADHTPMKRLGRPEEVADAVLFLASSAASYITGTELIVDGGVVGLAS